MRAVVQRSKDAKVEVDHEIVGQIDHGFVILLGVGENDTEKDVQAIVQKIIHLRIFEDEEGKMNRSLIDVEGSVLSISQFTLYANIRKGRRPSFTKSMHPNEANRLYELFNDALRSEGIHVETGKFGAMMGVTLTNDGPVTIMVETKEGLIVDPS
ncbi:D-aminoacyl-tRNA deacylase [Pseudogracilibacillus sp. ICA-222130]|uniref:D-aminoacyl-tRNA deacylase n=1 Tax=Pseudogracilibacillus sp. ICA-222130 TaxID=3134655 RepID=UPI0030C2F26F